MNRTAPWQNRRAPALSRSSRFKKIFQPRLFSFRKIFHFKMNAIKNFIAIRLKNKNQISAVSTDPVIHRSPTGHQVWRGRRNTRFFDVTPPPKPPLIQCVSGLHSDPSRVRIPVSGHPEPRSPKPPFLQHTRAVLRRDTGSATG